MKRTKLYLTTVLCLALGIHTNAQEKQWRVGDDFLFTDNTTLVGINTTSPQHALDVNGPVNAQQFLINGVDIQRTWSQDQQTLSLATGNVGIGTTNPTEKLTVAGIAHVEELKVDQNVTGPDYVFEPSYDLPSLEWMESYIATYGHLPYFPSATEMEAKGIDVEETQMALLRTLEEMVLHQIDLQKQMERLRDENEQLAEEIGSLAKE